MSRYDDAAHRWDEKRAQLRQHLGRLIPHSLTHYPFEVMVGLVALLMGLPFLLGTAAPGSLVALVGSVAFFVWAAALALGGGTILLGLRIRPRPNSLVVAAGLQLTAGCFLVYSLAVIAVLGSAGWAGFAVYLALAVIASIRAGYFRRIVDIQKGATKLQEGGT